MGDGILWGWWTRGDHRAGNREEIRLVELPDGRWQVRYTGPVGGTTDCPNRSLAELAVVKRIGSAWQQIPVRRPRTGRSPARSQPTQPAR